MTATLFTNAAVLDVEHGTLLPDRSVLVDGDRIAAVGARDEVAAGTRARSTCAARRSLPGLIDCHVHVTAATANLAQIAEWSPFYLAAHAGAILRDMLQRGFTTVRDAGGGDFGLAQAVEEGLFEGPRVIFGGKALSQTGGHGDGRSRGRTALEPGYSYTGLSTICDGVPDVRRAVREEIKRGAQHIKLMLSGGVASPTDRVDSTQFSLDEIRAAVEEAEAANIYVLGHAYTARAINRGLECGVRTIEHGNLMDATSPPLFLKHQAFYVPTLVTYSALAEHGREYGLPDRQPSQGLRRPRRRAARARDGPSRRAADRLRHRPAGRHARHAAARIRDPRPGPAAGRHHPQRHRRRRPPGAPGRPDRHDRRRSLRGSAGRRRQPARKHLRAV